jgi:hypothetical protein
VCLDVETEKNGHFRCEGHRQVDPVFDCGSPRVEEEAAADPDCDSHNSREALESEAVAGNSAEDNLLGADKWDDGLVQQLELKEFHERHRAWVVTLPLCGTCLGVDSLRADSTVAVHLAGFACSDRLLAREQRQPEMILGEKDSFD